MRFVTKALPSALLVATFALSACGLMRIGSAPRQIRTSLRAERALPRSEGAPHRPQPLAYQAIPEHPYMARHGASCMHADPYTTNTYRWPGPLGRDLRVESRSMGFLGGECPTINFDSRGRIVTVCVRDRRPSLVLLDPKTLTLLDRHALPRRRTPLLRLRKMLEDTSGGAYFYLDDRDRAVVGTADGSIDVIAVRETAAGPQFALEESIDLTPWLEREEALDKITAVLPDFQGNYWFSTRYGRVGVVTKERNARIVELAGEQLQNAFSVAEDGVYVVSDHALYRFALGPDGAPEIRWRESYDRGARKKVGQITQGSGTTPTLLGDEYVAIADNAEPRMNVLVYRRQQTVGERLVCKTPVFAPGQSATENTLIGYGRSLVVENNAGYDIFRTMRRGKTSAPGIARIDLRPDGSGCDLIWESDEISQTTVPKLSVSTGLIYLYTKLANAPHGADAYYFTAIDFATGRTVYKVLTGTGVRYDNNWAAISLAPDGSAYVGVLNGLLRVTDGPSEPPRPGFASLGTHAR